MARDDATASRVASRYELHEMLGQGGMGSVWRGHDALLDRPVAVKRVDLPRALPATERATLRSRVLREARAAARLSHINLVAIFDVVEEDGSVFLVQELVDAPSLKEQVARNGPVAPAEAARIGRQLLDGLAVAHKRGVVHRDVKPANVMVQSDGTVKLADFGIASLHDDPQITSTGMVMGSPAYMAPEQASGTKVGAAADVWSVGATLYYAVEGEPPFERADTFATLTAVVHHPPRPTSRAGGLEPALQRMLAKVPEQRGTIPEISRMLDAVMDEGARSAATSSPAADVTQVVQPTKATRAKRTVAAAPVASPVRSPTPAVEQSRPNRRLWLVTALVAFALVGGIGLFVALGRDRTPEGAAPTGIDTDPAPPGLTTPPATNPPVSGSTPPATSPSTTAASTTTTVRPPTTTAAPAPTPTTTATPVGVTPVPGGATYTDSETGYRVIHPQGWTVRDATGNARDFRNPANNSYLRVDWRQPPGPSAEGAWRDSSAAFARRNDSYREIQITPTTYQGHQAALWEYTYREGGRTLHAYNLGIVVGDRYGFALNFQTREEDWAASQVLWEQLKAGFQLPS